MQVRQRGAGALFDHDRLEVAEHCVLGSCRHTLVGENAGYQHGIRIERTQDTLEVGVVEGAESGFLDVPVLVERVQIVVDLIASGILAQASVLEERAETHERTTVFQSTGTMARPDHGDVLCTNIFQELLGWLDHPPHMLDVDTFLGVLPFRM